MLAIENATIWSPTDEEEFEGTILMDDGRIVEVGDVDVPATATSIDADGRIVTPGLVDAHSHVGLSEWGAGPDGDINEGTDAVTPHVSALDGFHPRDEELKHAFQNGITTISTRMGSANVIGGVICSMKTYGRTADEMYIQEDGMKAAMGENPKRFHGEDNNRQPSTRPGIAATLRSALIEAEDYLDKRAHAEENDEPFDRDLGLENLTRVLTGDLPLRVHAHRADDIMTVFRIADEFDLDQLSIEHATEGHVIADEFAKRDVPAIVGPTISSAYKYETRNISFETPGILHEEGVRVAIQTDAPVIPQKHLPTCVGLAVREGLPESAALDVVTRNPAEILGIDDRVGTLAPGTDADVVIWDGPFYENATRATHVVIDGELVYDHEEDAVDPRDAYDW